MHKKKLLIFILFFVGFFFCNPMSGHGQDIETLTLAASENIARGLKAKKFVRIAVTGIVTSNGRMNGLTTFFQESIATRLNNMGFAIPERERLEQVAKENSLSLTRAFDDDTAVEFGRFLNADAVITGTLTKLATGYVLNTRAVDCASGMMVPDSGYQGTIKANKSIDDLFLQQTGLTISVYFPSDMGGDVYIDGNPVNTVSTRDNVVNVAEISPGNHVIKVVVNNGLVKEQKVYIRKFETRIVHFRMFLPLKVRFWQEEDETKRVIGDNGQAYSDKNYRFCISANQDCHVYIFNLGTSGKFFPIVPNEKLRTSNFIEADKPKIIPGREENGFIIKGSPGEEKIYVIASVSPIENLDDAAQRLMKKELLSQGFSRVIQKEKQTGFSKDYGFDENQPAVSESASLDLSNPVVMELTYFHK